MLSLGDLGSRVCIIGPSNSGKSTLANAPATKLGATVCHLDQIAHIARTNWKRRPDDDFIRDHDAVIGLDRWVIDGNYSVCIPQRFERASSVIWIDPPLMGFLYRYFWRCLRRDLQRAGNLLGATSEFNLSLIKYTLTTYPKNRAKYQRFLEGRAFPILHIRSMRGLRQYYSHWELTRR